MEGGDLYKAREHLNSALEVFGEQAQLVGLENELNEKMLNHEKILLLEHISSGNQQAIEQSRERLASMGFETLSTLDPPPPPHPAVNVREKQVVLPEKNTLSGWSMWLGIVGLPTSIFLCGVGIVFSIPAVICGHLSLAKIRETNGVLEGKGRAVTGLVTGYSNIAISALFLLIVLMYELQ